MLEGLLRGLVVVLAIAGGMALLSRALRSALRLLLRTGEVTAASGLVDISLRRGDLTTLAERRAQERRARRRRRRDGLLSLLWFAWLLVPVAGGWLPGAYALAAPLWLVKR
jgi:hypothetical protein